MRMRRRNLALAAVCALCLMLPAVALAEETYITWESEPEESGSVEAGDTIRYAFTLEEAAQTEAWTALRVQLGNGLLLQPESISVVLAQQPSPAESAEREETPQDPSGPEATANSMPDDVQWEIIPGNDGFVVLLSSIHAGDAVSFLANVQAQGEVSAAVRTDAFTAAITHTLVVPPTPLPAAATPAPVVAQQTAPGAIHILLAVAIIAVLALIGTVAYRRLIRPRVRSGQMEAPSAEETKENADPLQPEEKEQDIQT